MGTGFWVIQAIFLSAAIATAVYAEVERRRDDEAADLPTHRQVPVEQPSDFTINEQARLLNLRGRIRQARLGYGLLQDDLAADLDDPYSLPPPENEDVRRPPAARAVMRPTQPRRRLRGPVHHAPGASSDAQRPSAHWTAGGWILLAGLGLFALGAGGMWQANVAMDAREQAQERFNAAPRMSFEARVVPGPIANPAKYLAAVNVGTANSTTIDAAAMLALKQAMDRWEAVLLAGLALLVASFARWGSAPPGDEQESSIANDLVGFIGLAALLCAGLSFFELA